MKNLKFLSFVLLAFCSLNASIFSQEASPAKSFLETLSLAQTRTAAKEWTEAAALWEKVVKQNPVEGRFWNQLATVYYNQKNYARAVETFKKVLEFGGSSPASFYNGQNPAIVTVEKVGEPTGSSPNYVGEEDEVNLPYSKIGINVSDLYWANSDAHDQRKWIAPQIYLPPTFEAFRANRDLAMEAILAYR